MIAGDTSARVDYGFTETVSTTGSSSYSFANPYYEEDITYTITRIDDYIDDVLYWLKDLLTIKSLRGIRTREKQIRPDQNVSPEILPEHPP